MSTASISVLVTKRNAVCEIEDAFEHFVYVLKCDGTPVTWCGTTYTGLKTKCGMVEVEVPPGCYVVGAVQNDQGIRPLGNHLTHVAIVRVNCGDHICVTLFDPTLHFCGSWFHLAMVGALAGGGRGLRPELVAAMRNAVPAVAKVVAALDQEPFVVNQVKALGTPQRATRKR